MHATIPSFIIRKAHITDKAKLKRLYQKVTVVPGGLARIEKEITDAYITKILSQSLDTGLIYVAQTDTALIGCMLAYKLEPQVFSHVLSETSILVDPQYQSMGVGTQLIQTFLNEITTNHPDILMVELMVRETNPARQLYERLGFTKQGYFPKRIRGINGELEADIAMAWHNPWYNITS